MTSTAVFTKTGPINPDSSSGVFLVYGFLVDQTTRYKNRVRPTNGRITVPDIKCGITDGM